MLSVPFGLSLYRAGEEAGTNPEEREVHFEPGRRLSRPIPGRGIPRLHPQISRNSVLYPRLVRQYLTR